MNNISLKEKIGLYLETLCIKTGNRHVGSAGNRDAAEFINSTLEFFDFKTENREFDCIDWSCGDVVLKAGGITFQALVSPYSPGCDLELRSVDASSVEELEQKDITGKILLILGDLAKEQLMPKNFVFYNPEKHKRIYSLLETKEPAAIITATGKNPDLAGSMYPFPLIEDGDFDIPSVYMKDTEGEKLLKQAGNNIRLSFKSGRIPSKGSNVVAIKEGKSDRKIVFCAHFDTKKNTPGALDNASGVAVLLALAELLKNYSGNPSVEIVAFNGEDYYSCPGQMLYLDLNSEKMDEIILAVNLDGAGYNGVDTSFSLYECPASLTESVRNTFKGRKGFFESDPWCQSDHMIFAMNKRPAAAITSGNFDWLCREITHTEKDSISLVDSGKLAEIAFALKDLVKKLN